MMKTKSKFNGRFLSILLTLVMCLTLLPMTVFAEGGEPEEIKEVVATAEIEVPKLGYKPENPKCLNLILILPLKRADTDWGYKCVVRKMMGNIILCLNMSLLK